MKSFSQLIAFGGIAKDRYVSVPALAIPFCDFPAIAEHLWIELPKNAAQKSHPNLGWPNSIGLVSH